MAEKLTWDEIKKQYPDEFVVLVDTQVDEATDVLTGTLVNHGKSKQEMRKYLGQLNPKRGACLWTGQPRGLLSPIRPVDPR
ncbi:MAG: hypothetical protein HY815_29005 [Candidatus Riflebacteria bacterium]|nr:hypothetical protein [Candidatus Riflebacteria bacterium]